MIIYESYKTDYENCDNNKEFFFLNKQKAIDKANELIKEDSGFCKEEFCGEKNGLNLSENKQHIIGGNYYSNCVIYGWREIEVL